MFARLRYKIIVCFACSVLVDSIGLAQEQEDYFCTMRRRMIREQIISRGVKDKKVLDAIFQVQRHKFVPPELQNYAYQDRPLPIGHQQTISQPYIVALMTELAHLNSEDKVLEIGTGSGYQAAILAEIAREVYTVEILKPLADSGRQRLQELGYENIHVHCGDGYLGWEEFAPYDAIIVTAAPKKVPQALIEQLKLGGRLVIPVGGFFQDLKLIIKTKSGLKEKAVIPVRFVPMIKSK